MVGQFEELMDAVAVPESVVERVTDCEFEAQPEPVNVTVAETHEDNEGVALKVPLPLAHTLCVGDCDCDADALRVVVVETHAVIDEDTESVVEIVTDGEAVDESDAQWVALPDGDADTVLETDSHAEDEILTVPHGVADGQLDTEEESEGEELRTRLDVARTDFVTVTLLLVDLEVHADTDAHGVEEDETVFVKLRSGDLLSEVVPEGLDDTLLLREGLGEDDTDRDRTFVFDAVLDVETVFEGEMEPLVDVLTLGEPLEDGQMLYVDVMETDVLVERLTVGLPLSLGLVEMESEDEGEEVMESEPEPEDVVEREVMEERVTLREGDCERLPHADELALMQGEVEREPDVERLGQ